MRCTPDECPHCVEWGFANKVRCERNRIPPQRDGRCEDATLGSRWFSTIHGSDCQFTNEQFTLFEMEEE